MYSRIESPQQQRATPMAMALLSLFLDHYLSNLLSHKFSQLSGDVEA
jgi:hypothetical protein